VTDGSGRERKRRFGKSEGKARRDTPRNWRIARFLSDDGSLTLLEDEGICGRFGRIGVGDAHIGLLGFRPDDVGVSFTTCGSRYFGNLAHDVETDLFRCDGGTDRCAKVRRQG